MIRERKVIVISGPSGVGKTTLCNRLTEDEPRIKPCITATTRFPRPGETNGRDYHFITQETFRDWLKKGEIIEYTQLFGDFYGTPKKSIEDIFKQGYYPLLRIDITGARNIKRLGYNGIFIFILPPNSNSLSQRLKKRQTSAIDLEKRLAHAEEELKYKDEYQFQVVNDNLEQAAEEIKNIFCVHLFNTPQTSRT